MEKHLSIIRPEVFPGYDIERHTKKLVRSFEILLQQVRNSTYTPEEAKQIMAETLDEYFKIAALDAEYKKSFW
jgi:hypothetical protein